MFIIQKLTLLFQMFLRQVHGRVPANEKLFLVHRLARLRSSSLLLLLRLLHCRTINIHNNSLIVYCLLLDAGGFCAWRVREQHSCSTWALVFRFYQSRANLLIARDAHLVFHVRRVNLYLFLSLCQLCKLSLKLLIMNLRNINLNKSVFTYIQFQLRYAFYEIIGIFSIILIISVKKSHVN